MSRRWPLWLGLSASLALLLGYALVAKSGVDLAHVASRVWTLRPEGFVALTGLIALSTWLSAVRWRLIALRTGLSEAPSPAAAFALTALGVGVGQVIPVQLAAALSRGIGGRLFGDRTSVRTAVATLYEQSFDLGLMVLLAGASGVALALRSTVAWAPSAALVLAAAVVMARVAPMAFRSAPRGAGRVATFLATVTRAGAFEPALLTPLLALSAGRFAILVLMAWATSWCSGLEVQPLALAVALPLVALATAVPVTPAGFGVNEWTFAAVLVVFGVPLETAAEWALVNRVLVMAASLLVAAGGVIVGAQARPSGHRPAAGLNS